MAYELDRFSPQSFERFAQSLALARLGPGTQIYGAGRDGAREATFEGVCTPTVDKQKTWNGYVVLQAKYSTQSKTSKEVLAWLKKEVDRELAKFMDDRRNLRRPDFYILVTNVALTAGAADIDGKRGGTLDAFRGHMSNWSTKLEFKDYYVWDKNVLSSFLDAEPELRKTFSAWTMPGDVLSSVLSMLSPPNFQRVVNRLVRDELRQSRNLKTRDSGQAQSRSLFIDEVFVDLPLVPSSLYSFFEVQELDELLIEESIESASDLDGVIDAEALDLEELNWNIVNALMERSADALSPSKTSRDQKSHTPLPNRVVILGGPGQGKSTIGQFFAQLMRSRLAISSSATAPDLLGIAADTVARAAEEGIFSGGPLRFPLHIELPKYADYISKSTGASIVRYASSIVGMLADEEVEPRHLYEWLAAYPSVIILDGLDEVPRSSNRRDVLLAINKLAGDLHASDADALLVVTSRPQGYVDDLDRKHWAHWEMAELNAHNATRFFSRLGSILISDHQRRAEVLGTLSAATLDPATSPLMISPLQISLLFSLVETRNDIPRDRWTLFERHYEILRDREISKGGQNGELIRNHRADIDRIHYDAGFLLQVRAESSGNANAYFTTNEFYALVHRQISRSLEDLVEINRVSAQIAEIATTRLVFLGAKNEEQIAFDVRSLQEFMAAARIMVSPETIIPARLKEIAVKSHWLHVFKIACSKVYAQATLEDFRGEITRIVDRLDAGDDGMEYRRIRAGARLAISLLADSTAGSRPVERQALVVRALRVLHIPGSDALLPAVLDSRTTRTIESVLTESLLDRGGVSYVETLQLLLTISRNPKHSLRNWAAAKIDEVLTRDPQVLPELIAVSAPPAGDPAERWYREIAWMAGPAQVVRYTPPSEELSELASILPNAVLEAPVSYCRLNCDDGKAAQVFLRYFPVGIYAEVEMLASPPHAHPGWKALEAIIAFSRTPSIEALTAIVEVRRGADAKDLLGVSLPWVVAEILRHVGEPTNLENDIRSGKFGNYKDWLAAEQRWKEHGSSFLEASKTRSRDSLEGIENQGAPLVNGFYRQARAQTIEYSETALRAVLEAFQSTEDQGRQLLISAVVQLGSSVPDDQMLAAILEMDRVHDLSRLPDRLKARLLQVLASLREKAWESGEILRLMRSVVPNEVFWGLPGSIKVVGKLVGLLENHADREWVAALLFKDVPRQQVEIGDWIDEIDPILLKQRASDSVDTQVFLGGLEIIIGKPLDEVSKDFVNRFEKVSGRFARPVLYKIYRAAPKSRALDDLIIDCALRVESEIYRRTLSNLISEILAARESRLADRAFAGALKLPEMLPSIVVE